MTNIQNFNKMPYGTITTKEVLKVIESLKLRGYTPLKNKNSNGDYNYLMNFFIFKKNNKKEYIRLTLLNEGWHEKILFYWNLELSFKPFGIKHNQKMADKGLNNIKSITFKINDGRMYYVYFIDMINKIKLYTEVFYEFCGTKLIYDDNGNIINKGGCEGLKKAGEQ